MAPDFVPIGLEENDVTVKGLSLFDDRHIVVGKAKTGKSNVMKIILMGLPEGCKAFVADSPGAELAPLAKATKAAYMAEPGDVEGFLVGLEELASLQEQRFAEAKQHDAALRPRDFFRQQSHTALLIDDGDSFLKLVNAQATRVRALLEKLSLTGCPVFTGIKAGGFRDYGDVATWLKEAQSGVVLGGNTNDQAYFDLYQYRAKADPAFGFVCSGGDVHHVKIPLVR